MIVPITKGKLDLGPWQQIFYYEFDGKRPKRLVLKAMGEMDACPLVRARVDGGCDNSGRRTGDGGGGQDGGGDGGMGQDFGGGSPDSAAVHRRGRRRVRARRVELDGLRARQARAEIAQVVDRRATSSPPTRTSA